MKYFPVAIKSLMQLSVFGVILSWGYGLPAAAQGLHLSSPAGDFVSPRGSERFFVEGRQQFEETLKTFPQEQERIEQEPPTLRVRSQAVQPFDGMECVRVDATQVCRGSQVDGSQ